MIIDDPNRIRTTRPNAVFERGSCHLQAFSSGAGRYDGRLRALFTVSQPSLTFG